MCAPPCGGVMESGHVSLVGLDIGTSGVKGIALDPDGVPLARAQQGLALDTPRPGWAEQDPEAWWSAAEAVLGVLEAEAGPIEGIGLSGQMHGLVALDAEDRPLRPAILWNDQRTAAECEEIERRVGRGALVARTGNRALTGFTAPKLLWMRRHEPELYARIHTVLLPKDYVRLRLCGERAQDVTDASGTLLFDVAARRWSPEIAEALEIPLEWLPRTLESAQVAGSTPAGIPVVAGAGDQAAGALGVGVLDPGRASVVLGTSGVVFAPLADPTPEPEGRTHTFCHVLPDRWHAMGVMLSAAGSLEWFRNTLAPGVDFATLTAEAAIWPPGAEGLTFLPYLAGERTPHADPDARGVFSGLSLRHDRGALVRAVLEGVCFGLRDCLDLLREGGAAIDVGIASGGGASSDVWLQMAADILELPLRRPVRTEGAALGAALLAGVGAGTWSDVRAAAAAAVDLADPLAPDADRAEAYRAARATFSALYPAIAGTRAPGSAGPDAPTP